MNAQPQELPLFRVGPGGETSHWYRLNPNTGKPECCYQVLKADGKSYKDVTLREARIHGLVPGSSAILGMAAKPQLARWQRKQMMLATLDANPEAVRKLLAEQGEDKTADDIYWYSQQQVRAAASSGTDIHAAIERWYEHQVCDPQWQATVEAVRAYLQHLVGVNYTDTDWCAEGTICSPLGFGGRIDLYSREFGIIVDLKTKDIPAGVEPYNWTVRGYDDQARQLAGYRKALPGMQTARCVNLFIARPRVGEDGTLEDLGQVCVHEWEESDLKKAWQEFYCLLRLWQISKEMPTPGMGET